MLPVRLERVLAGVGADDNSVLAFTVAEFCCWKACVWPVDMESANLSLVRVRGRDVTGEPGATDATVAAGEAAKAALLLVAVLSAAFVVVSSEDELELVDLVVAELSACIEESESRRGDDGVTLVVGGVALGSFARAVAGGLDGTDAEGWDEGGSMHWTCADDDKR